MANDVILQKPPRLLNAETGGAYDWREFDRWLRRVYDLLAIRADSNSYSIVSELDAVRSSAFLGSTSSTTETGEDPFALLYAADNSNDSTTAKVDTDALTLVQSVGGTNGNSLVDENYLTLYWMGV